MKSLKDYELKTVYETTFDKPIRRIRECELLKVNRFAKKLPTDVDWVLEGAAEVSVKKGRLHLKNDGDHCVLWSTREFLRASSRNGISSIMLLRAPPSFSSLRREAKEEVFSHLDFPNEGHVSELHQKRDEQLSHLLLSHRRKRRSAWSHPFEEKWQGGGEAEVGRWCVTHRWQDRKTVSAFDWQN